MCCENGACRDAATRSDPPSLCNERTVHSGSSLRSARTSGLADASSGPSPGEAAARSAFARPIFTRAKPAAERTGPLSSSARKQPSARGRLRAADRFAIAFASGHHIPATRRRFATNGIFRPRLAKRTHERTCGREVRAFAGRSCGPLRPAGANSAFKIQYSKFRITRSGCSLRKARQVRQRTAGLRRREAAARRCLTASIPLKPSPFGRKFSIQNSELHTRAAVCGVHAKFGNELRACAAARLRPAGLFETEFVGDHFHHNGRGCAPLGPDGAACGIDSTRRKPSAPGGCRQPMAARSRSPIKQRTSTPPASLPARAPPFRRAKAPANSCRPQRFAPPSG